ncbi:retinol-binding protein pinta-like [Prorops nasuta]|uniref:retinol-binding protein pinta-like n=1 Tax=Prorops nasuta TaxID=863751 RepID=UPI0034CF0FC3
MTEDVAYVCQLTGEEREYAAINLNEQDETRAKNIAEIKEWLNKNDDLISRTDDFFILRFLRTCKFDIERTKRRLRNYHEQRTNSPEWFLNRDPLLLEMQEFFNMGVFLPLKKPDNEGRMVIIIRCTAHDPSRHEFHDLFKACLMILELAVRQNESVSLHGIIAILDMSGASIGHALQLPPAVIKKVVHAWQGCYPVRVRSMDFVNAPLYVNVVLKIFKKFMTPKLKQRVHIHFSDVKTVLSKLPPEIIPIEYGGTEDTLQDLKTYWKQIVEENRTWLMDDEKYKAAAR